MTRDMRVFKLIEADCTPIMEEINKMPRYWLSQMDIAIFEIIPKPKQGYLILSVSDEIDSIVTKHGAEETDDLAVENLRITPNYYPFIFGQKTLTDFIPYIIPYSPANFNISGKSGQSYGFKIFNIFKVIRDNAEGVYLFTQLHKDNRNGKDSHLITDFVSIGKSNAEAIQRAKEKGIKYYAYYYSSTEDKRREIINDIKESEDYQYQLETFPNIVGKS